MERRCEYRNCGCDINHKDPRAKFCDRKCKGNERKYKRREQIRFDKEKENINKMLEEYKKMQEMPVETRNLWKLIYGK